MVTDNARRARSGCPGPRQARWQPGQPLRAGERGTGASAYARTRGLPVFIGAAEPAGVGDIIHDATVPFEYPEVAIELDPEHPSAVSSRRALLSRAASRRWWIAGAHLPFPGLGRTQGIEGHAYRWVPVEYGPVGEQL